MSLLVATNLSKVYGAEEIFSDVSAEIPNDARIALVGPNGAGKTTLINLFIGHELPTEGNITTAKDCRIAFLPQRPELAGNHTLWEEALRAFSDLRDMEAHLHTLADQMANPDTHDAALAEYGPLQDEFERLGGYTYETRLKMVLTGVGFDESDYTMPLTRLSGGQKTRAMLARLLLEEPDLLILDEPTNHLDIQAVEWLEDFLKDFSGAVLAVSHDRYFIDHFASVVWEMEFGSMEVYRGNYTQYLNQREERHERLQKEYEAQQAFIAKEQDYIRKHMGSRWTAQAKGRLKKLETMRKRGKIIERGPRQRRKMKVDMITANRSGDKVLMAQNLQVGYDDALFTADDVTIYRGETVAIIGPNGAGKSTLLKTVTGELPPLGGTCTLGAQVQIGYFAQAHEGLNPDQTVLDEIMGAQGQGVAAARDYLGKYLFSGDDVLRPIGTLSGGERGRVALAKLALEGANLLLLDEPTNHLDIDSQEILQSVLEAFNGTILLVSHDRYLIDALATQIWAVSDSGLEVFDGTYAEYIAARNQRRMAAEAATTNSSNNGANRRKPAQYAQKVRGMNPYELQKYVKELEDRITDLEGEMDSVTQAIEQASAAGQADRVRELGETYTRLETELDDAMTEWGELVEHIDD